MRGKAICRVLGLFLIIFSLSMVPPIAVSEYYVDGSELSFILSFVLTLTIGFVLWFPFRTYRAEMRIRDGFIVVVLFWVVLSFFGSLPFLLPTYPRISVTNSIFETVSGLTATGASVLSHVDKLPQAIRYYRQQLEFLGGMGVIVLAIAILPMLGIGGMQLYRAEVPGPIKDQKLTPRMTETAKRLWYVYVGFTALCALAYWFAGMPAFDAICESFATVSTGGFSIYDTSFAFHASYAIEIIAVIFMIIGGASFNLHYLVLQRRNLLYYWKDVEFRNYIFILFMIWVIVAATLLWHHTFTSISQTFIESLFNVVSLGTTTGFTSTNFSMWPTFVPYLMMCAALIGGCAGSTAGGIKVLRAVLLRKQGARELKRLIHPHAVYAIHFGDQVLSNRVTQAIWGFIAVFTAFFIVVLILLLATGLDFTTAFGAAVACLSNAGASIGKVANCFYILSTTY